MSIVLLSWNGLICCTKWNVSQIPEAAVIQNLTVRWKCCAFHSLSTRPPAVQLQESLMLPATTFAADLSGAWSWAQLNSLVITACIILRLPLACLCNLTLSKHNYRSQILCECPVDVVNYVMPPATNSPHNPICIGRSIGFGVNTGLILVSVRQRAHRKCLMFVKKTWKWLDKPSVHRIQND